MCKYVITLIICIPYYSPLFRKQEHMRYLLPFLGLALLLNMACQDKQKAERLSIQEEIASLKTVKRKKAYLEDLFKEDQKLRQGQSSEIMARYGRNSPEDIKFTLQQIQQDSINLVKVEQYLSKYGYPNIKEVGDLAAQTPWAVIHHSSTYEERERNFEYLYGAYLDGNIDDGAISFYLGRMYEIRHGERLQMKSPFKAVDEINQLVDFLELTAKKKKVEESR